MHDAPGVGVVAERCTALDRLARSRLHPAAAAADVDDDHAREDDDRDDDDAGPLLDERHDTIRRLKIDIALARSAELGALEARLYKHVVDCIDFDALFGLEQVLWFAVERLGHGALDDETGLSRRLIERALIRAAQDPHNTFSEVPVAITAAERRAAPYDPECPFCELDDEAADHAVAAALDHERGGETCPLCDDSAREWRDRHAEALRAAAGRRDARRRGRSKHRGSGRSGDVRASNPTGGATRVLRRNV